MKDIFSKLFFSFPSPNSLTFSFHYPRIINFSFDLVNSQFGILWRSVSAKPQPAGRCLPRSREPENSNSVHRLDDAYSGSRSLPLGNPRGSRWPVGATRLPCAISPSTSFFASSLSSESRTLSLSRSRSFSRPSCAFRYTRRPARTSAIRFNRGRDAYSRKAKRANRSSEWLFWPLGSVIYFPRNRLDECISSGSEFERLEPIVHLSIFLMCERDFEFFCGICPLRNRTSRDKKVLRKKVIYKNTYK